MPISSAMQRPATPTVRRMAGVGLIEVLVTLIVFSLGMLSLAALQGIAKKANFDALQRTNASLMAFDLLERMRSNNQALANYVTAGDLGGGALGVNPILTCDDINVPCTTQQIAAFDLWEWERILDGNMETRGNAATGGLVGATACINGPVLGGSGGYTVVIAWRGVTQLTNPPANPCGSGLGRYGNNDELRRLIVVQTFIGA